MKAETKKLKHQAGDCCRIARTIWGTKKLRIDEPPPCGMIGVSHPYQSQQEAVVLRSIPPTLRAGTLDLPAVPLWLQAWLLTFLGPVLSWAETRIYRHILAQCANHPLVQLGLHYDPAPVIAACASFRAPPGRPGAPPDFTVEQLVRAEIVRAWAECCSERDLEWLLISNLVVRWFVGLSLFAPRVPDHTTLKRFHTWMRHNAPDALFEDVLRFLQRVDPEDAQSTPQILDTFGLAAPVEWPPRIANLLLELCDDLVRAWLSRAPRSLQHALPPLDFGPLRHPARPRDAIERQALLVQAVGLSLYLRGCLAPHLAELPPTHRPAIRRLLDALAKVVADEVQFDPGGYPSERTQKGSYRIASATDLDASFRHHDDDLTLGYNVALATTGTRITAAVVLTGATPDQEAPEALLRQQLAAGRVLPRYVVMDQAAGWGKTRARVDVVSDRQTLQVALIPPAGGADPRRFGPANFRVDAERTMCTCPQGVVSTHGYSRGDGDGVKFRFLASQCRGCVDWTACRGEGSKPKAHRMVFISDYQAYLRQAAVFNQSAEGKELLARRWRVEPEVAWLTRYQGCRRARCLGREAAQFQVFMACAVRNLLRWLARRKGGAALCTT